jgi:hypothetical protein
MKSKRYVGLLMAVVGLLAAFAAMSPFAQAKTPLPGYSQFAGCPSRSENPKVNSCLRAEIYSGRFKIGSKEVPIEKPITLKGGVETIFAPTPLYFNSEGGLSKAKQKVPGGVIGLTGLTWLLEFLGSEALTLYATAELVGTPIVASTQYAQLPLRVHLENGVLGNNCYIGSSSNPVTLNLTTGTSGKLTGKNPRLTFEPEKEITEAHEGTYVDNTFAAPGVNGCVLTLFGFIPISINGLVNSQSGLPAASGTNEAVQNFNAEVAAEEFVYGE